ncbi:MAG: hypothetical protein R3207_12775, partial [Oceanospirillum sp.]|nr:hypothetical protein [Oceanospirillum sp.]
MDSKIKERLPLSKLADLSSNKPLSTAVVAELLDAKIIIGGSRPADTAFTETLLQISGFTHIHTA